MATLSSILAWRIPCTEEPGGLQSMGSQRDQTEHLTLSLFHTTGIQVTLDVEGGLRDESPALGASDAARPLPCPLPPPVCGASLSGRGT